MNDIALLLRAMERFAWRQHHVTRGAAHFGDHEFWKQTYKQLGKSADKLIERITLLTGPMDEAQLDTDAAALSAKIAGAPFAAMQKCEQQLCAELTTVAATADLGTNNLLGQLADDSLDRQYQISRRLA